MYIRTEAIGYPVFGTRKNFRLAVVNGKQVVNVVNLPESQFEV